MHAESRKRWLFLLVLFLTAGRSCFGASNWPGLLAQDPKNQTALHAMAKILKVAPELVQTRMLADELLRSYSATLASEKAFYSLIGSLETLGDFRTARKAISDYIPLHPRDVGPLLAMAYDYYLEGDFRRALAWYNRAVALDPRSLDGYHGIMLTLAALNDARALDYGKYILSVSPGNVFALIRSGNYLYARKEYRKALQYYSQAPYNVDFQLGMGLCHFRLGEYAKAAPLLRGVAEAYPQNRELLDALRFLNNLEIAGIRKQLSSPSDMPVQQLYTATLRMVRLHELNGEYGTAADLLKTVITRPYRFETLLRLAGNYSAAGSYQEAGNWYLQAIPLSTDPWATSLAAADCLLLARDQNQAFTLLARLNQWKPGKELWPFFGRLYQLMNNRERARIFFDQLGVDAERRAATLADSRQTYLYAIDCFLDAGNYGRARFILDRIDSFAPGADLDWKYIRYYTEQKDPAGILSVTAKYPHDAGMLNSRGWAYVSLNDIPAAERTFRKVLSLYPGNAGAAAGLKYTNLHRPWEAFLGYTGIGYGGYQDDRGLLTESVRYSHRKTMATVSHTRTDVKHLSAGATDFNEDLYGGKVLYLPNERVVLQMQGMTFQNDDVTTDGSSVLGGKVTYLPDRKWLTGLELDVSGYRAIHGTQISPFCGYQFTPRFRADAKGIFTATRGSRMRASQDSNAGAGLIKGTYDHDKRLFFTLGGILGRRRLYVDGDALYAFNTLDLYKNGGFAQLLYNSNRRWQLYLSYSVDSFESERLAAANEAAGAALADPSQTSRTLTTGAMYQF